MKKITAIILVTILIIGTTIIFWKKTPLLNKEEQNTKEIFQDEYTKAQDILNTLTLEEKIGQLFLVRTPETNVEEKIKEYSLGGLLLFAKDFENLTELEVIEKINNFQLNSKISLFIAVDEEGGSVIRVSSNPNLTETPFLSPSELYKSGGLEAIKKDTIEKTNILYHLGINLNLAPVVDIAPNPQDYMYKRSLQENAEITSDYAKTVIEASDPKKVSFTLKHFPGYGNNIDTHQNVSVDNRSLTEFKEKDFLPFQAGIESKAEAILISHNIITAIDEENPASLSKKVHDILRNELSFTGVIITDNLDMAGVLDEEDKILKAITSGNDLIITTDFTNDIQTLKNLLANHIIQVEEIDKKVLKILAWKIYKGLL